MNGSERHPGERYPGEATLRAAEAVRQYRELAVKYTSDHVVAAILSGYVDDYTPDVVLAAVTRAVFAEDAARRNAQIAEIRARRIAGERL